MQTAPFSTHKIKRGFFVFFIFLIAGLLLFLPIIDKGFASDDFLVLHRIVYEKVFFIPGFFRPLSDLSLYTSYLMGGFNPVYYNIFNITIHAGCAFLLYRICLLKNFPAPGNRLAFAWLSSILFLIYPFHNEAVIWAIGRGIVLSGFFGLLSLLVALSAPGGYRNYLLSCFLYFISLCGYETSLLLPVIVLLLLYKHISSRKLLFILTAYSLTLALNLVIRLKMAGTISGDYGSRVFSSGVINIIIKFSKATGRLLLPPSAHAVLLGICFALLIAAIIAAGVVVVRQRRTQLQGYMLLIGIAFISIVVPALFGVSTKTYEGDRVFYFTSFFLGAWLAYLIMLLKNNRMRWYSSIAVAGYFLFFFYRSILTWEKSGVIANSIISAVRHIPHREGKLYLVNLPEEYNGAPVFRNGFTQALLVNRADTTGIVVVNYLSSEYAFRTAGNIQPVQQQDRVFIYPSLLISNHNIDARIRTDVNQTDSIHISYRSADKVYYWDKKSFVAFPVNF